MNKQQKNYIKAVAGFVLAAIILGAGIMTALYLMREEGMENLMAPVLKRLIAGILLFGLTVCWRHF